MPSLALRQFLKTVPSLAAYAGWAQAPDRPNIIYILADDLGWGDLNVNNEQSRIPTPHADRLASQGMRFLDMHSPSAVCTPTRYGILTGRYCWRTRLKNGVLWGYDTNLIESGRRTVASLLKSRGYHTAGFAKWHLGLGSGEKTDYGKPLNPSPIDHGFDTYFGIPASLDMDPYVYITRRTFLQSSLLMAQQPGARPPARPQSVEVINPRERVPLAWIIDDSTCLVNLIRFSIPQFAATFPERYKQDWRSMPYEIPDSFVRRFAEWSQKEGVKGKYSIVPFPACVGRLDREVPGWTPKEITDSIKLVRDQIVPNWDIHPEMITHTRIIDLKTGHPVPERGSKWLENWEWCECRSVDEIAAYIAYSLQILKNVDLHCDGFTTPGSFGLGGLPQLSQAAFQAVRSVYGTEVPHFFRNVIDKGSETTAPRIECASGLDGPSPQCVVSIYACTGDWTGNWDATQKPDVDRFISPDLSKGRMVEVIDRGDPALMLCHWTGITTAPKRASKPCRK